MHGDRGSRRALMVEVLAVDLVISLEVVHVHEEGRYLGEVAQVRSGTGQDVAHVLDYGAGLGADVEVRCSKLVHLGSGDGIVRTAGTRPREEEEIAGALKVGKSAAGRRFALDHGGLHSADRLHHPSPDVR